MSNDEQLLARYKARERFWAVIALCMDGDLSESQACELLAISVVDLRDYVQEFREVVGALWKRYMQALAHTEDDDIKAEAAAARQMGLRRVSGNHRQSWRG